MPTGTPQALAPEDRAAVLAAVNAFAVRALAPVVARPEVPPAEAALAALDEAAAAAGVLPGPLPGWAPWEEQTPIELSLAVLRRLARESAGVAYRFHLRALAVRTARALEVEPAGTLVVWEGPGSLGKGALGDWLRGDAPEVPPEVFPTCGNQAWAHTFGDDWVRLLLPGARGWRALSRDEAGAAPEANVHGLAEAPFATFAPRVSGSELGGPAGVRVLSELVALQGLGAAAVALGAVDAARAKALAYAHERRQGGALLRDHAAVRLLIADAAVAVTAVEAMLAGVAAEADAPSPGRVCALRAAAHPLLCQAANQCLQVFGGYGYMQDYGLEKIVRDCNALRLVGGGPTELRLHVAGEEYATWNR